MQEQGFVGRMVGNMVRRSVRQRFHTVWWNAPQTAPRAPAVLYANHHGWMDGYLMFYLVTKLGLPSVDWIEEYDAFPLFKTIGGIRFAAGDTAGRALAVRQTIRLMKHQGKSLVIFPEGVLHQPPDVLPFGKALETVATKVGGISLVPVAIRYEMSLHERPEAFLTVGQPHQWESLEDCRERLVALLANAEPSGDVLVHGTRDINERMDMRRAPRLG